MQVRYCNLLEYTQVSLVLALPRAHEGQIEPKISPFSPVKKPKNNNYGTGLENLPVSLKGLGVEGNSHFPAPKCNPYRELQASGNIRLKDNLF